jgi:prepilin-type N-terminal cleavage/methylation domain-containing protein
MPNILKSKKGTSLIEVMVAVLILTIVIAGGSFSYIYGRSRIDLWKDYRAAGQLAAQKLEELKAGNYDDIEAGGTEESLSLEDSPYGRSILTEDVGLYKKVTVAVHWQQRGEQHYVSLTTFIAPE